MCFDDGRIKLRIDNTKYMINHKIVSIKFSFMYIQKL